MRLSIVTYFALLLFIAPAVQTGSQKNDARQCPISKTQDIPTVNLCDVVRKPADYDRKLVRLKAHYLVGGETRIIDDPKCEGAAWVEFDNVSDVCTDKEILDRIWNRDPVRNGGLFSGLYESEIVAVGLLLHDEVGFGHMNAYKTEFAIKWIEQVKLLSKKK